MSVNESQIHSLIIVIMTRVYIGELCARGFPWSGPQGGNFVLSIKQLSSLRQTNDSSDCMWVATSGSSCESNEFRQADLIQGAAVWRLHLSDDTITAAWLTDWQPGIECGIEFFLTDGKRRSLEVKVTWKCMLPWHLNTLHHQMLANVASV